MTSLPPSVPHAGAVELGCWVLQDFHGLRSLRAGLRQAAGERMLVGLDDLFDRMAVVATELATNGLRHGAPPTVVRLLFSAGLLIIDVADSDLEVEPDFHADRPLGQGGLGLLLTRTFARETGWYRAGPEKHVWASFAT